METQQNEKQNSDGICRYNTRSNKVRVVKTPGGSLRYLHIKKAGTAPKCGDCGIKLPGVSGLQCKYLIQDWWGFNSERPPQFWARILPKHLISHNCKVEWFMLGIQAED